jgi:hypothetical protein
MSESIKAAAVFVISVLVGFGLFATFFRLHFLRSVDIVFYRGLILIGLSGIVTFVGLIAARGIFDASPGTVFSATILSMSLNLSFLVVFPVTIDRSITVFLLNEMNRDPDVVFTSAQMKDVFVRRYLGEWDQIDRRMREQVQSHNLERIGDGYKIGPQGRSFMNLSRMLATVFDTDPRFVDSAPKAVVHLESGLTKN